jgi:hypothetical protein
MTQHISRINGKLIDGKSLQEKWQENPDYLMNDEECEAFHQVGQLLANEVPIDNSILDILYSRWNFSRDIIKEVFDYFEDFDSTEKYLNIMDGGDKTIVEAWETWCDETGACHEIENNPFLK